MKLDRFFVAVALMSATSFIFSSCGKDDNKSDNEEDNNEKNVVSYNHEYVDLGLTSGTLWAAYNIGAESPEEYGEYFAWGETETKQTYTEDNSKWFDLHYDSLIVKGIINTNYNLKSQYDVATMSWGEDWRMPTRTEVEEILSLKNEKAEVNGITGRKFIGKNGNTLFLPFTGERKDDKFISGLGRYWSSSYYDKKFACSLYIDSDEASLYFCHKNFGFVVRPVLKTKSK